MKVVCVRKGDPNINVAGRSYTFESRLFGSFNVTQTGTLSDIAVEINFGRICVTLLFVCLPSENSKYLRTCKYKQFLDAHKQLLDKCSSLVGVGTRYVQAFVWEVLSVIGHVWEIVLLIISNRLMGGYTCL